MKLHFIDRYDALVKSLIFGNSDFQQNLYLNANGDVSIGYNFDLQNDHTVDQVLEAINFDPKGKLLNGEAFEAERYYIGLIKSAFYHSKVADLESLTAVIDNILMTRRKDSRYTQYPRFKHAEHFRFLDISKGQALCFSLTKHYEKVVDDWITSFGFDILKHNSHLLSRNSKERAVLVSLAAQGILGFDELGSPTSIPLANTIIDDNRSEAWYQIRYGLSLKTTPAATTIKRQYFHSEVFGLYDEGVNAKNINREQCKQIYSMYNLYKEQILYFERTYNHLIADANEDYKTASQQIKTLEQSFSLAYNYVRNVPRQRAFAENYVDTMEEGVTELVKTWSQDDDLDHEIAIAS